MRKQVISELKEMIFIKGRIFSERLKITINHFAFQLKEVTILEQSSQVIIISF